MSGLAGIARARPRGVAAQVLERMAAALRHRGPDGFGLFADERVGLAHARLAVLDLERGKQPMGNEDGSVLVVHNGEVFNYLALRHELELRGHVFRTRSDTEVLVHAYEQWGERMLECLNGQFAFAIYDRRRKVIFFARDRFGILPLYYTEHGGDLYLASEVKALFATGEVERALDPEGLDEVFTFWAARPPRTPFRGIRALEPGCSARWEDGRLTVRRYYALDYPEAARESADALSALDERMRSAVRLRLRADVPVGGYLSGGVDSSLVCALGAADSPYPLRTFSATFADSNLDESTYPEAVAAALQSRHAVQRVGPGDIARVFPDVVRHAETPVVRTAPASLFLLSRLVRERGIKVVLSGEGSDEAFYGCDLFKDAIVRSAGFPDDPLFSHLPRFRLTARIKNFYTPEWRASLMRFDPLVDLREGLPPAFPRWSALARAAYLEVTTLLSPYLLSSQGDRMAMAHGVEARVPFLDHRLFEFAAALPPRSKLRSSREKDILRRWAAGILPPVLAERRTQPYRAPDVPAFFDGQPPEYVDELLDPRSLSQTGIFQPASVTALARRCRAGRVTSVWERQAFVAIISTELWHREFLRAPGRERADVVNRMAALGAVVPRAAA